MTTTEAQFTWPSDDCPRPDWWHSWDSDSAEVEVGEFLYGLVRLLQPSFVVETGTAFGRTAEQIGLALRANGHGHLDTLELDPERCETAAERCRGLPVTVLERDSLTYTPHRPIDLGFFDSELHLRADEYTHLVPHAAEHAVAVFHDTAPHHRLRPQLAHLPLLYFATPRGLAIGPLR